ncbi:major facilitator family transporter [Myxococcus stipitatus DSM 14675]|uniref:MFS-type drug efflux transporter P55 n=1 Tax=Myxococcus stipitatus (strain DSM 14675 / JCM 12634 / Mx s8) TaxID=1278073 RepID=L7U5D3_MYXSD|nr:MFS transporter [Myxococcus stipitatus]AGC43035.1 major facilitator family transporter [Myxococcus stipitatus DSM 14675]
MAPVSSAQPGAARRMATGAVLLALVVSAFEGTVVTSAMPTITRELGGQHLYSWVFSAFLFASTVGVLISGKLADRIGRKPVFFTGMGLFLVGSALCGLSQSVEALIAFRVVQGLGAGALQPTTLTISADLYTLRERATVQGLFTGAWGAGNAVGPLIGGWLVMNASWRWVFLVNVPVGVFAALLLSFSYRDPPRRADVKLDRWGPLLAGSSAALLLFSLEPGDTWLRVLCVLGAVAVAVGLVLQQRQSRAPLLPIELVKDRTVLSGVAGGIAGGALLYSMAAWVPLWMTEHEGKTPIVAGLTLLPMLLGWSVGSTFGVKLLVRGGMRLSAGVGFAVAATGAGLLALTAVYDWGTMAALASLAVLGMGLGPAASTSLIAPQSRVAWHHRGIITSSLYSTRLLGGSLTVAALALARGHFATQFAIAAALAGTVALLLAVVAPGKVLGET